MRVSKVAKSGCQTHGGSEGEFVWTQRLRALRLPSPPASGALPLGTSLDSVAYKPSLLNGEEISVTFPSTFGFSLPNDGFKLLPIGLPGKAARIAHLLLRQGRGSGELCGNSKDLAA